MAALPDEDADQQLQRYSEVAGDAFIVVLSVLGALASVDGSGWSLPLLALAVLGLAGWLGVGHRLWQRSMLGSALAPRTLVIVGCGTALSHGMAPTGGPFQPSQVIGAVLGAALLVGGVVGEPYLRRAARFQPPVVANLPGITPIRPGTDLSVAVGLSSLAACLVGLVWSALGLSSWWWVLVCALALVPAALVATGSRARIVRSRQLRVLVPRAVSNYAPEFVVYTSRPDDASYQVTMWLPYLKRAGKRFIIITRNGIPAAALAGLTDVPIVEARKISDLDALVPPSLKAAFYVNASSGNGVFVRYQHLTHIYLGHGDSDKPPSYNPTHAMYDRIFAAGPAAARRYGAHGVRIAADKFQIVGRPQVEDVKPATGPIAEVEQPVVLYAPTWRGHVEETMLYSLPVGERIVSTLLQRGATVIFRPHPFSYDFDDDAVSIAQIQRLLAADAAATGRAHLWGAAAESERGILDCINASDAMVSDVSSVVSDYLFSGKPFAMIAVPTHPQAFVVEYPVAQAAYVVSGDLDNLDASLAQMLGPDPLASQRNTIRTDYLGDFPAENYASAFVEAVRHVSSKLTEVDIDDDESAEAGGGRSTISWSGYRRLLADVGLSLMGTLLALCSLVAALLEVPAVLTFVLVAAALAAGLLSAAAELHDRSRWERLLTESDATRSILLMVLAIVASNGTGMTVGVVLACYLLAIALIGESHIKNAWGRVGLEVQGFPAVRAGMTELFPRGIIFLGSCAVILLTIGLGLADAPGWSVALLSLIFFALFTDALIRALVRAQRVLHAENHLHDALAEYAPEFSVYFASTVGAAYQVGMWLPFLARIGRPFIIVTRSVPMMREIGAVTRAHGIEIPIIHRPTLRSLEDVIVGSMTTAFYVNNAVRNTHFVERRELTHVWLNHGDSEKPACFNPVHAIYDLLFAAGQAGVDRYQRHGITIPIEKFRIVGRPQVEQIEAARGPVAEQQPQTVLYAPTWQGPFADTRVYSLPLGKEIVQRLLDRGVRVIFRAHPFNYRFPICVDLINEIGRLLTADNAATGRNHLWGAAAEQQLTVEDCFNASDAMISDVSAVVSDYLRSEKPFAIVSVGRSPEALLEEAPAAKAAYVLRQDLSNLDAVLDELLGTDPLAEVRQQTKIYYLGNFGAGNYAEGFLRAAREVIDSRRPG
jgi:CDP-glycerol glycerophosphotransferase (TagB/SpsB family)